MAARADPRSRDDGAPTLDDPALFETPGGYLPADIDGPALAATVRAVAQGLTVVTPGLTWGSM